MLVARRITFLFKCSTQCQTQSSQWQLVTVQLSTRQIVFLWQEQERNRKYRLTLDTKSHREASLGERKIITKVEGKPKTDVSNFGGMLWSLVCNRCRLVHYRLISIEKYKILCKEFFLINRIAAVYKTMFLFSFHFFFIFLPQIFQCSILLLRCFMRYSHVCIGNSKWGKLNFNKG